VVFRRHGEDWSDPVFMTFVDYSVGFQIGGAESALGKLGVGTQGGGSFGGGLEMISVSTKKGLQIGGNVADTRHPADKFNKAAYGENFDIKQILAKPGGKLEAAKTLREALVAGTKKSFSE
jgi:lipid-binding SYLF domain-containing protein